MRTPQEILASGAAWITESELARIVALAERAGELEAALRETGDFLRNTITFDVDWEAEAKALVARIDALAPRLARREARDG